MRQDTIQDYSWDVCDNTTSDLTGGGSSNYMGERSQQGTATILFKNLSYGFYEFSNKLER
jgi:hypothetical protein